MFSSTNFILNWSHKDPISVQTQKQRFKLLQLYILFANLPLIFEIGIDFTLHNYEFAFIYLGLILILNAIYFYQKENK